MTLKEICLNNLIIMINNLPPVLKDEVIGKSKKDMESEARLKVIQEMKYYLPYIIENMVSERIKEIEGINLTRNVYPQMSQDIINICEDTSENVTRLIENKVMNNAMHTNQYMYQSDSDDS